MRRAAQLLLLAMLAVGVLLLFVFPARTLLAQRHEVATTESHIAALTKQNAQLAARSKALNTPGQIEQIAHQQYGMVMPGQNAYTVVPKASPPKANTEKTEKAAKKAHHWWQSLEFWH